MSPINHLSVLALAAGALAVPNYQNYHNARHGHHWHEHKSGSATGPAAGTGSGAPYAYPNANATGIWGSTGFATGTAAPSGYSAPASSSVAGPRTVTVVPYAAEESSASELASSVAAAAAAASTSTCTDDVTVTTTQRTYVTVTATREASSSSVEGSATQASSSSQQVYTLTKSGTTYYHTPSVSPTSGQQVYTLTKSGTTYYHTPSPSSSVVSSSSTAASSVTQSSSSASSSESATSAITYSAIQKGHRWGPSPSSTTSSAAVSTSAASSSVYVAPTTSSVYSSSSSSTSSVYVAPTSSAVYSSSSAAASSSSTVSTAAAASTGSGKRGVAYNDASLTDCFAGSDYVSWGYNWGSASSGLGSSFNYIPLLWGTSDDFTSSWSENAKAAIAAGSTHLFSFNEPDLSSQANLSPAEAASAWTTYMEPFAGQAKLCAPAVTNGGGDMGLTWLSNFLDACTDCTIDCVSIHWYDSYSNTDYFQEQVTNATTVSGKPVFVSEFGSTDGSDDDITDFLQTVMPWMGKLLIFRLSHTATNVHRRLQRRCRWLRLLHGLRRSSRQWH